MKTFIKLFIITWGLNSCTDEREQYTVDPLILENYNETHESSEFIHSGYPINAHYANAHMSIIDNTEELYPDMESSNLFKFVDTTTVLIPTNCCCGYKNDTVFITAGIVWEAGIGFNLKIYNGTFQGEMWMLNKGVRTTETNSYPAALTLKTTKNKLIIDSEENLSRNSILTGKYVLESEEYYRQNNPSPYKS